MVAGEDVFELAADEFVEGVHVGGADALAVWRIGDEHACGLRGFGPRREGSDTDIDVSGDAGTLEVAQGDVDGLGRDVAADNGHGDVTFGRIVVIYAVEELAVEVAPALEGESAAVDARIDVGGNHRGLAEECARAAHRVDERHVAAPAALEYNACGKHLVDGRLGLGHTIAALVERLAR